MITTVIGKTFLKAYNKKYGKGYSAKEFFEEVYFELFFNHNRYLMTGGNSPFENPKISWDKMIKGIIPFETDDRRRERLHNFMVKAESSGPLLDMGIAPGYPASEEGEFKIYSGAITDLTIQSSEDDIYFSWFGASLGIGVKGGYNLLINDDFILLGTYEGWEHYRKYLNDPTLTMLTDKQVNSWNGQWLAYKLGKRYDKNFSFATLEQELFFKEKESFIQIDTIPWSKLFFSLSNSFSEKTLNSYIYSLGNDNQTIGFIPIYLKAGKRLKDVFKQLFHLEQEFDNKDFQALFGMHIKRACELGNIGLQALRPENLKKYMTEDKNLSFKKAEDNLIYQSYKTWLIAMITKNKEEITDYTSELAKLLHRYRGGSPKTDRKNLISNDLLGSKSKKGFIDALTEMVSGVEPTDLEALKKLRDEVHLMTNEEFGYFNTLLKFDYAFTEKQS